MLWSTLVFVFSFPIEIRVKKMRMANGLPTQQSRMTYVCTALCAVGWVGLAVGTRKTTQTTLCFGEEKGEGRGEGDHIFHPPTQYTHLFLSVLHQQTEEDTTNM